MDGARSLDVRLQASSRATAVARKEIGALASELPRELREDLQLLVSELVANSLRHAELTEDDWIGLRARLLPRTVRVEVSDPGRGFQSLRTAQDASELPLRARSGLWMLDRIADRWGVVRDAGTHVWFEADLPGKSAGGPHGPDWTAQAGSWPEPAGAMAREVSRLYGPPDEVGQDRLLWRREGGELLIRKTAAEPSRSP